MPIRHAIWKVGDKPMPLSEVSLGTEALLENRRSMEDVWRYLQRGLAGSSRLGRQRIVPGSGHNIHLGGPGAVVGALMAIFRLEDT